MVRRASDDREAQCSWVAKVGYATGRVLNVHERDQMVLMKQYLLCSGTQETVSDHSSEVREVVRLIMCFIDKRTGTLADHGDFFPA
jgi:hypothetical protein